MPSKRSPELEDFDLELPDEEDASDTSDEGFSPDDDSDFELNDDEDDDAGIGLDTAVGFDDGTDDLELSDDGEGERWSGESEDSEDLPGADADVLQGEEYGWIDEEADADDDEGFDPELRDDDNPARDDGGAEGVDDDADLDELDLSHLPELGSDQDEEPGASGELFEELPGLAEEPTFEIAAGELWKALAPGAARVTQLLQLPAACTGLALQGTRLFVAAGGLWELDLARNALQPLPLPATSVTELTTTECDGVPHLAVIADGKVFLSNDGGVSFVVPAQPDNVAAIAFTGGSGAPVLWCLTSAGALRSGQRREGQAVQALQGKVSGVYGDGARRLVALVRRQGRLWLSMSRDGGKRFGFVELPSGAVEPGSRVFACRDALVLSSASGVHCALPPQAWLPVPRMLPTPVRLSDEDEEVFLYGFVRSSAQLVLVRRAARANVAPTVIAAFAPEFGEEPQQLAVHYAEAGAVTAYVACSGWLLRVDASLDGEDLA